MILSFSLTHNGKPTNFPALILLGLPDVSPGRKKDYDAYIPALVEAQMNNLEPKIHTIQDNTNRWSKGKDIHFTTGNRTAEQRIFGFGKCQSTQLVLQLFACEVNRLRVYIDGRLLAHTEAEVFALNDGFATWEGFCQWFVPLMEEDRASGREGLERRLIHWTKKRY